METRIRIMERKACARSDSTMDDLEMTDEYEPAKKKRVRAKLDHLSPSEKLQRRKLANRIAAQTARDKKRAKLDFLEEENRKLREENERLKTQLTHGGFLPPTLQFQETNVHFDSGASDLDSTISGTPRSSSRAAQYTKPGELMPPQLTFQPTSPGSSTSGAFSSSSPRLSGTPVEEEYINSVVGEANESALIDDILLLQNSLFDNCDDAPIESAELINAPQQKVQGVSSPLPSEENSVGWTSIQLMLLLMICKVHRQYSLKTNCCATNRDRMQLSGVAGVDSYYNLYDYINQTKCIDFRRAAEAVIMNKNNTRQQRLAAFEYANRHMYNMLTKPAGFETS